jgi:hypothetical protein
MALLVVPDLVTPITAGVLVENEGFEHLFYCTSGGMSNEANGVAVTWTCAGQPSACGLGRRWPWRRGRSGCADALAEPGAPPSRCYELVVHV